MEHEPKWSKDEAVLGDRFLEELHKLGGNFKEHKDEAAHNLSVFGMMYNHYYELPSGTKSYVSHCAALAKEAKKAREQTEALKEALAVADLHGEGLQAPIHDGMTAREIEDAS